MRKTISVLIIVISAAIAMAQSPGIGIKKDTSLTGTGSSGSPLGIVHCGTTGNVLQWSGTVWACQAVSGAVSDGDKGDVIVTSSGTVWTIDTAVVTLAKMADLAQATFIGRASGAGTGVPTALTATQATASLNLATTSVKGLAPVLSNVATQYLDGTGAYSTPSGAGDITGVTVTSPACSAGTFMTTLTGGATSGDAPIGGTCTALNIAGASCSAGQVVTALSATGTGTCTALVNATSGRSTRYASATTLGNGAFTDDGTNATTNGNLTSTAGTTTVGDLRGTVVAVSGINGTQNDWTFTGYLTATHIVVAGTSSLTLNGLQGGADGRIVVITNGAGAGVADISVNHENAGSTAANRFKMAALSGPWILAANESAVFIYNGAAARWIQIGARRFPSLFTDGSLTVSSSATVSSTASFLSTVNLGDATNDTIFVFGKISGTTKIHTYNTAPTLSACGTSPTVLGNDIAGRITMGTGGTTTACTATFSSAYTTNAPVCVLTSQTAARTDLYISAASPSAITISNAAAVDMSSAVVNYHCYGVL